MYIILYIGPDIGYTISIDIRFQSNPRPKHLTVVKHSLKCPRRIKDSMLAHSIANRK